MSELADFPTIEAMPMPTAVTEVLDAAPAAKHETAIALVRRTTLAELTAVERGIAKLKADHGATDYDITTPKGLQLAKDRRLAVREVRYQIPHAVKARKAELKEVSEALESEAERITAELLKIETPHDEKIKAREKQLADEKAERERIEDERLKKHSQELAVIRSFLGHCQQPGMTAARIQSGIDTLAVQTYTTEHWQEFAVQAANAQCETLEAMRVLHAQATEREAEAARLEAQRVENERVAREQAEQRAELDRQAAVLRAEQQRIAGLQARIAEIRAAATGHEKASAWDLFEARVAVDVLDVSEAVYAEFAALAQAERATTLKVLEKLHADAVVREAVAREMNHLYAACVPVQMLQDPRRELSTKPGAPLLQDECKGLSVALATKPDAPMHAREAAAAIEPAPVLSDKATADASASAWVDSISTTLEVIPPMAGTVTAEELPIAHDPQAAFLALVMSAFDCKCPSHPKPTPAWWAQVRAAGIELQGAA